MRLDEIKEKLQDLQILKTLLLSQPLNDEQVEMTDNLFEDQKVKLWSEWRNDRLQKAVDILFPQYDIMRARDDHPPRYHVKSFWWNGASIEESHFLCDGSAKVNLRSYVGGDEYDHLHELLIPASWIEVDDQLSVIHEFFKHGKKD